MKRTRLTLIVSFLVTLCANMATAASALAATPEQVAAAPQLADGHAGERKLRFDVEIDPMAYAMDGYSMHLGGSTEHWRMEVGLFGMHLPEWVHGNKGFSASFTGYSVALQTFPFAKRTGPFVGIGGGMIRPLIELDDTNMAKRLREFSVGTQVGWRIDVVDGFYVSPWVGLDYSFDVHDVKLGGKTYKNSPWTIFPTVHLGYRF